MHPAVEQRAFLLGFLDTVADHDEGAGQDLQVLAVAAELVHAALDVGIELLSVGQAAAAGEYGFRGLRRQLPAVLGCAGLHDHGQPWTGRAMLSGPRTDRYLPL